MFCCDLTRCPHTAACFRKPLSCVRYVRSNVFMQLCEGENERACVPDTETLVFSVQAADFSAIISWIVLHAQHLSRTHTNCFFHFIQAWLLYGHYCQADAGQPSLTCLFCLIHLLPPFSSFIFICHIQPLFVCFFFFLPDGFNLGATADSDRGQAQGVFGEPDGTQSTCQAPRRGLNMATPARGGC